MDPRDWMNAEISTGTSIIAVEFNGGVVIGADSRTTSGTYVTNRISDKLTQLTEHIYCCRSGSAAYTQNMTDIVRCQLELLSLELGEPVSVKTAANTIRQHCYHDRGSTTAGIICAGWDKKSGGQVYSIPMGGMVTRQPLAIGGSGSTYVYGFADANFKPGIKKEACVDFVTKALALAMTRDGNSGGVIKLGVITRKGMEKCVITENDFPSHYQG